MGARLTPDTPRRGSLVRIPARMGREHTGRVIRVVLIRGCYEPSAVIRYYRVEGYPLLVADAELVAH